MRKRNLNTMLLIAMRRFGMLCRKAKPQPKRLRIAKTVYPEHRMAPIDSERAVWAENKKATLKGCQFDATTNSCVCGIGSIESFANNECPKRKQIKNECNTTK